MEWSGEGRKADTSPRYLKGDITSSLGEGVSQQKHVIHTDPQCQKGQHLRRERFIVNDFSGALK